MYPDCAMVNSALAHKFCDLFFFGIKEWTGPPAAPLIPSKQLSRPLRRGARGLSTAVRKYRRVWSCEKKLLDTMSRIHSNGVQTPFGQKMPFIVLSCRKKYVTELMNCRTKAFCF